MYQISDDNSIERDSESTAILSNDQSRYRSLNFQTFLQPRDCTQIALENLIPSPLEHGDNLLITGP